MTFFGMALRTAIGTVVLAVFAVVTAWYARKAFREQSREVAAIEQQVKDEQEVTRQQAELVKIQDGHPAAGERRMGTDRRGGPPPHQALPVLAPETDRHIDMPDKVRAMFGVNPLTDRTCVVSVEFTDAAGNRWHRDPRGALNPRP